MNAILLLMLLSLNPLRFLSPRACASRSCPSARQTPRSAYGLPAMIQSPRPPQHQRIHSMRSAPKDRCGSSRASLAARRTPSPHPAGVPCDTTHRSHAEPPRAPRRAPPDKPTSFLPTQAQPREPRQHFLHEVRNLLQVVEERNRRPRHTQFTHLHHISNDIVRRTNQRIGPRISPIIALAAGPH